MKVSVYEAKSKLSQMINRALDGEEVIITRNGTDTARLVPIASTDLRWLGMWEGQGEVPESFYVEFALKESSR